MLAEPTLIWVMRGELRIDAGDGTSAVPAGEAIWIPRGATVSMEISSGDTVVPIVGVEAGACARPRRMRIHVSIRLLLLAAFGETLGFLDSTHALGELTRVVTAAIDERTLEPRMPMSAPALLIAARIRRAPATALSVREEAADVGWSARTLQRRFEEETGTNFTEWVRTTRAAVAARELSAGRDVGWVAQRVGYTTTRGFARMFEAHTGVTPARWRNRSGRGSGTPTLRAAHDAPSLSSRSSWRRLNGAHVAVWVVHGAADVYIGERHHRLTAGDAAVLPAGLVNRVSLDDGSVLLPLGFRSGADLAIGELEEPARFDAADEQQLIHAAVAAYTPLRANGSGIAWGFDTVLQRSRTRTPSWEERLLGELASGVARGDPAAEHCVGQWSVALGVSEIELRRAMRERTRLSFATWLRLSRMSRARAQLHRGTAASTVARTVGYAHAPAFTRAFRAVHGTPPHEHLRRAAKGS